MVERMVPANGVEICTESFGDPADPPVLLVMGIGASMLWWDADFCDLLARGGRFVVRYDHRDTGRSVTYEPGGPGYTGDDLVDDAAGLLDTLGIRAAHVVGVSAGGAFAQLLALDRPDKVSSLVLISTTPALSVGRDLPPPTKRFGDFVSTAVANWSDTEAMVDYQVGYARLLAGGERPFDEVAARALVQADVRRARDYAAIRNHDSIAEGGRQHPPLSSIDVPTLVIHGTADPMFPVGHGEALAAEIPGARLLSLPGAGHGLDRSDFEQVAAAVLAHTGPRHTD